MATKTKAERKGLLSDPRRPFPEREGVLLTRAEAADYLGCTERQIQRLLARRAFPKVKLNELVRIHIDDLNAYIESRRVK